MKKILLILSILLLSGCETFYGWEVELAAHNCGGVTNVKYLFSNIGLNSVVCMDGRVYKLSRGYYLDIK